MMHRHSQCSDSGRSWFLGARLPESPTSAIFAGEDRVLPKENIGQTQQGAPRDETEPMPHPKLWEG